MAYDYYETSSEDTAEMLRRMQIYVDLALQSGDVIYQEKPDTLVIKIRRQMKEKK